jgi:signal transduction histidine kinase
MSLPFGAVVTGLLAFYWQYSAFRMRRLAELKLARRTAQVERQQREIERRRELEQVRIQWLEQMARFLRHELRNALVGATTSLTLLQRRSSIPEDDTYAVRTRQALRVIGTLLESVSEATGIESTLMKEKRGTVQLRHLVQEQVELFRSIYPDNVFRFETDGEDVATQGRAERFIEMLDNLASNAVDHAEENTSIVVSCHRIDGRAVLKVINQGSPLADNQAIFGRFTSFREHARRKDHLGLGLYMVKLIAERYGGNVEARNRTDAPGVEFKVEFPTIL